MIPIKFDIYRAALGHKFSDDGSEKAHDLLKEFVAHLGKPLIGEHVRCLGWIDLLAKKRIRKTAQGLDRILENTIEEHIKAQRDAPRDDKYRDQRGGGDLVDILLNIQDNNEEIGFSLSRNSIKAIILVLYSLLNLRVSHLSVVTTYFFQKTVNYNITLTSTSSLALIV